MKKVRMVSVLLQDILVSCELIYDYINGLDYKDFLGSIKAHDCVNRRIEIIGEIVKSLPTMLRTEHPEIPWKSISGMRDILIHEYYHVDLALSWNVCQVEIPKLERLIKKIQKKIDSDNK